MDNLTYSIRRTVNIPIEIDGVPVVALLEISGKIWGKANAYMKFFELSAQAVEDACKAEMIRRGFTEKQFYEELEKAKRKIGLPTKANTKLP